MPLADFLTQVGGRTAVGQVGRIFGGQTDREKVMAQFVNTELPALTKQLEGTTDRAEGEKILGNIFKAAVSAGVGPRSLERLQQTLAVPFVRNMQRQELESIGRDYGPQKTNITPMVAPEGQGEQLPANTTFTPQETPGKPRDLEFNLRLANAGVKPDDFGHFLQNPEDIRSKQLGNQKTEQNIQHEQAKEQEIGKLSTEPGPMGITPQGAARLGFLPQLLPQREESEGKLAQMQRMSDLKEQGLQNALSIANQRVGAANDRASTSNDRAAFTQAHQLRGEFQKQAKDFGEIRDSFNRIQTSGQNPSPAGDMSMLFAYMKMLDPGSVVRESEFRAAQTAKPLLERLGVSWDAVGSIWAGQKMTPSMRTDFLNRASQIYNSANQQQQKLVGEYKRLAEGYKLDPNLVITDMGATSAPEGQGRYSEGIPSGSAPAQQVGGQAPTGGTTGVMRNKSKSGKPIVSTDGGKTWRYE